MNEDEITSPTINIKKILILAGAAPCGCPALYGQFVIGQAQGPAPATADNLTRSEYGL